MAVSPEVYKRLMDSNPIGVPDVPSPSETSDNRDLPSDVPAEQAEGRPVGSGEFLWENIKAGLASGPEMANWAVRTVFPFDAVKKALPSGGAEKAVGVDENVLRGDPGALTSLVGGAARGLGMTPYAFLGPMRGVKPGIEAAGTLWQKVLPYLKGLEKSALVSMGAGEGAEAGKLVGGGVGEFFAGEPGKEGGEAAGSIVGGTVGGYANVVRVNAAVEASKAAARASKTGVTAIAPAMKAAFAARTEGDTRALYKIYFDKYQDLRTNGLGWLQNRTNAKVADLVTRDPRAQKSIDEFRTYVGEVLQPGEETILDAAGKPTNIFSTAQISDNPILYAMERARREIGAPEASELSAKEAARRTVLTAAFKRITDKPLPTNQAGMEAAINAHGQVQLDKIASLENDASQVRTGVTNLSSEGLKQDGAFLRQEFDKEKAASRAVNRENYENAFRLDRFGVDIAPVRSTVQGVLDKFESQIKTGTAPESIENLKRFIEKGDTGREGGLGGRVIIVGEGPKDVRVPLRDLDGVIKSLGGDAAYFNRIAESGGEGAAAARATARNLSQVRNSLLTAVKSANPEAAEAYAAARSRYELEHVPRFNTGVASAMDMERATPGARGRPKFVDEQLGNIFLNKAELPTRMAEFDTTFGGTATTPRNEAAYQQLGKFVEDKFSKEVLNHGFTPDKAAKFAGEYESALDRVPAVRDKLARSAERLDKIKSDQESVMEEWKTLFGDKSTITNDIGPLAAQQLFTQALGDPKKMRQLLDSPLANTPEKAKAALKEAMMYANPVTPQGTDYTRLATLMEAGQHRVDMPNTLEMLTTKALGEKEGAAHLDRLKMISELMRRDAMLDPAHIRIAEFKSADAPVRGATGQTLASWLTGFRSMDAGFGKNYFPVISAGRFVNTQIQKAVDETVRKAMYDPEASKAVLSMAATPHNQPLSDKVLEAVFGNAPKIKEIVTKDMLERGLVRKMTGRGAAIGAASYLTDEDRRRKRDKRREEQGNIDLGE